MYQLLFAAQVIQVAIFQPEFVISALELRIGNSMLSDLDRIWLTYRICCINHRMFLVCAIISLIAVSCILRRRGWDWRVFSIRYHLFFFIDFFTKRKRTSATRTPKWFVCYRTRRIQGRSILTVVHHTFSEPESTSFCFLSPFEIPRSHTMARCDIHGSCFGNWLLHGGITMTRRSQDNKSWTSDTIPLMVTNGDAL